MLRDEIARYTELSGNDGLHTPIGIIGAYLDGYEKGKADAQQERKKGKWCDVGSLSCRCSNCGCKSQKESLFCPNCGAEMEVSE